MKAILSGLLTVFTCAGCTTNPRVESNAAAAPSQFSNLCNQSSERQTKSENGDGVRAVENDFRRLLCLDGGEVEDVYRSLGSKFSQKPRAVLSAMENAKVPPSSAAPMLVMLPLSYVDNPCAGRDELQHRRQIVVGNVREQAMKDIFLSALDGAIAKKHKHCIAK